MDEIREETTIGAELVPQETANLLPMTEDGENVDYNALLRMPASPQLIAKMIGLDLERLKYSQDPQEIEERERLESAIPTIIELYDADKLPVMHDVFEIISLAVERNPKSSEVVRFMMQRNYTAEGVAYLYDVKDTLELSLDQVHSIFLRLGFSLSDEQDIELVESALESIRAGRDLQYQHTAGQVLLELIEDDVSLRDIIEGQVY